MIGEDWIRKGYPVSVLSRHCFNSPKLEKHTWVLLQLPSETASTEPRINTLISSLATTAPRQLRNCSKLRWYVKASHLRGCSQRWELVAPPFITFYCYEEKLFYVKKMIFIPINIITSLSSFIRVPAYNIKWFLICSFLTSLGLWEISKIIWGQLTHCHTVFVQTRNRRGWLRKPSPAGFSSLSPPPEP